MRHNKNNSFLTLTVVVTLVVLLSTLCNCCQHCEDLVNFVLLLSPLYHVVSINTTALCSSYHCDALVVTTRLFVVTVPLLYTSVVPQLYFCCDRITVLLLLSLLYFC